MSESLSMLQNRCETAENRRFCASIRATKASGYLIPRMLAVSNVRISPRTDELLKGCFR